jgi:ATP-binding cassette subfamily D (ALD) long-chain fatty acid import protein
MGKIELSPDMMNWVQRYSKNKQRINRGMLAFAAIFVTWRVRRSFKKPASKHENNSSKLEKKGGKNRISGEVDAVFVARFKRLFKIIVPGVSSKEFWLLSLFSGFLV